MTAPAKKEETPLVKSEWVCVGNRLNGDGQLVQSWLRLDAEGRLTDEKASFGKRGLRGTHAGAVFRLTWTGDSVKLGSEHAPEFVRRWEAENAVEWAALSEAAKVRARAAARARGDKKQDQILECLAPLREAMRKTDRTGRRAIAAMVLQYLYSGSEA